MKKGIATKYLTQNASFLIQYFNSVITKFKQKELFSKIQLIVCIATTICLFIGSVNYFKTPNLDLGINLMGNSFESNTSPNVLVSNSFTPPMPYALGNVENTTAYGTDSISTTDVIFDFVTAPIPKLTYGAPFNLGSDVTTGITLDCSSESSSLYGMVFNDDGTKIFTIGSNTIFTYDLAMAFDLSTAVYAGAAADFSVSGEESFAAGLAFSKTGDKMFVVGLIGDDVVEYNLGTDFDVSTAVYAGVGEEFSVASEDSSPFDVSFIDNGNKMIILGRSGGDLLEYDLASAYDVSTAVYAGASENLSIGSGADGFDFNADGSKLFVVDGVGLHEYSLSTAFDVSTGVPAGNGKSLFVSSFKGSRFSSDGSRVFGFNSSTITEYNLTHSDYTETIANIGAVENTNPLLIGITGDSFVNLGTGVLTSAQVTITGVPPGLTPILTLTSATIAELTFTGNAANNINIDDVANLSFAFNDSAFTLSTAAAVTNSGDSTPFSTDIVIDFEDNPIPELTYSTVPFYYSETIANVGAIDNTSPLLITLTVDSFVDLGTGILTAGQVTIVGVPTGLTAVLTLNSATIAALTFTGNAVSHGDVDDVAGLTFVFNDSAFTLGDAAAVVNSGESTPFSVDGLIDFQYNPIPKLTYGAPYNLSSSVYSGQKGFLDGDSPAANVFEMVFNNKGTKLFTVEQDGIIRTFDLATPFNVLTAVYAGAVTDITVFPADGFTAGLAFNHSGTKLLVLGLYTGTVYEYNLSTAFDMSTAVLAGGEELPIGSETGSGIGFSFNNNGEKMFIVDLGRNVYEYDLAIGFDVSTAVYTGASQNFSGLSISSVRGLTFNADGSKLYLLGAESVHEIILSTAFDVSTGVSSGVVLDQNVDDITLTDGFLFTPDGSQLYVHGRFNNTSTENCF